MNVLVSVRMLLISNLSYLASAFIENDFDVKNRSKLLKIKSDYTKTADEQIFLVLTPNIALRSGSLNLNGMLET